MLQKLMQQFIVFSRENWWVYLLLGLTVITVFISGRGNFTEIIILFLINLSGAICNMLMMSSYKNKKFAEGSVFILIANTLYTGLSLYAWVQNGDIQYIFWQLSFFLTGLKAFMLYTCNKKWFFINFRSIFTLNSIVLLLLVLYVGITTPVFIQSLGIFLITLGLALTDDIHRYFLIISGNLFVVTGSMLLLGENYIEGNILGVTVAYTLLGLSTFVYYLKLFPLYISRFKKL